MHTQAPDTRWREDARTIALVGLAHGSSHFFRLLLTVFFVFSGVGQMLAGFIVDCVGARRATEAAGAGAA